MNLTFLNVLRIAFAILILAFGVDKFFPFLPTCSLNQYIPPSGMIVTGLIEIGFGITLLLKKYELIALKILTSISIGGVIFHLIIGTTDFKGAIIASLMGLFLIFVDKKQIQAKI